MRLIGKRKLRKLAKKNRGNVKLQSCIKSFEKEVIEGVWTSQQELGSSTVKFDSVHSDGFYIVDINIHRAMIAITFVNLIELEGDEEVIDKKKKELGEVDILWVGTHDDYELTFGNNKDVIERWLRSRGHIH